MRISSSARVESPVGPLFAPRVLLFAAAVPLLLKRRMPELAAWLEPAAPPPPPAPPVPDVAERLLRRIDRLLRLGRPLVRPGCLTRGITQFYFLRRAGVPVSLRFGIGEVAGEFTGHCWLVKEGEPFGEAKDPRALFIETYTLAPGEGRPGAPGTTGTGAVAGVAPVLSPGR